MATRWWRVAAAMAAVLVAIVLALWITAKSGTAAKATAGRTRATDVRIIKTIVIKTVRVPEPVSSASGVWDWHEAVVTAYSLTPVETGKHPGDPGWGVTASGLRVRPGTAAVDPRVIPLGTVLWIPGVGPAVALDTGGGVKGWHVDVYMRSTAAARRWGRKHLVIGVLRQTGFEAREDMEAHGPTPARHDVARD